MKILCAPDLHCWWSTYEKDPYSRTPDRLAEWKLCADEIVNICLLDSINVAIFPGDYFVEAHPDPLAVGSVLNLFQTLESIGVKVIGISGNHDDAGPGQENFVDVIGKVDPHWGITFPMVVEYEGISFIAFPYMKPIEICDGNYREVSDVLTEWISSIRSSIKGESILLAHWSTDQSVFVNDFKPPKMVEPVLWIDSLKRLNFNACILGHIHKPQVICDNPLILHTGVMTRGKSDEGRVTCGVFILDTSDYSYSYLELPARNIVHIKFPQEQMENFENGMWAETVAETDVADCIVTVSYQISENNVTKVNHKDIIDALYIAGAYHVDGIHPTVIRNIRQRAADVNEETDELESFRKWYQQAGCDPDLEEEVITEFQSILDEVK